MTGDSSREIGCGSPAHFSRRTLLQWGAASGIAWLTPVAEQLARAAESAPHGAPAKSVIVLWMAGGPSQHDTFDPMPGKKIGGEVKAIATASEAKIAAGFEQLAEQMNHISLIRSITSKEGDHERATYNVKTGFRPTPTITHPSIGAIACHELPVGETKIPRHISILPNQWPGRGGYLGQKHDAFRSYDPKYQLPDVAPRVGQERLTERFAGLQVIENAFAQGRLPQLEAKKTLHNATMDGARAMMDSDQRKAFDVSLESAEWQKAFGDNAFGRGCLAAARLIQVGVRCVEVTLDGWDSHVNNFETQKARIATLDPAYASLLRYLKDHKDAAGRSLLDSTLVLWAGEFGRTPTINPAAGRDHWPHSFTFALAGGGIRGGLVHGATDPEGGKESSDPVTIADVHATMLSALGIDGNKEFYTTAGRPIRLNDDGGALKKLLL